MTDLDYADDLHALMDRALADTTVPTARLQEGALRAGRRVRRRRHALAAVGALAATAVVGLLAVPSLAGSESRNVGVAHDASPSPSFYDPPPGWWDMPGRVMRNRLADLIAPTLGVADANLGNEELAPGEKPHGGWVSIDVEDHRGRPAGGVNVVLYPPFEDDGAFVEQRITCPGNLSDPATPCTEMYDEKGGPVGRTSRSEVGGVVVLEVTQLMPDGGLVYASASNSSDDKWGEGSSVDAEEPAITAGQLKAIALSPEWTDWEPRR